MDEVIKIFGMSYGEYFLLNDRGGEYYFTPNGLKRVFNGVTTDDPRTLMDMLSGKCMVDDIYDDVDYGDTFWYVERTGDKVYHARSYTFDIYDPVCLALYKGNNVFKTKNAALRNVNKVKKELMGFYNDCVRGYDNE